MKKERDKHRTQYQGVSVAGMAPGGWGVVDQGGNRLLVWGGLMGDRLDVRVVRRERDRTEAAIDRIVARPITTTSPSCSHFDVCGGCLWQHVAYEAQLQLKRNMVQGCFLASGLDADLVKPLLGNKEAFFYRNKMDFTFGPNRLGQQALGMFESPFKVGLTQKYEGVPPVFEVETCWLQSDVGNRMVAWIRQAIASRQKLTNEAGNLRSLVRRDGKHTGEILVHFLVGGACEELLQPIAQELIQIFPQIRGVVLSVNPKRSKHAKPTKQVVLAGQGWIFEHILGCHIRVSATSFLQVNTQQAERLYAQALDYAELTDRSTVLDLYCGTGTLSLLLAQKAARVVGVEVMDSAIHDACLNAEHNGIANCRFVCGDVLKIMPELANEHFCPDVVMINPPRAGIYRAVIRQICDLNPARIVYISCQPETLARDLVHFVKAGYHIVQVQPVDLFPQTPHVEVVVKLEKSPEHI